MVEDTKTRYPQLPMNVWWNLRSKLIQSIPPQVTESYMTSILRVQPVAAKQYIRYLRELGLIDDKDKPTDLAKDWRNDNKYTDACAQILERCYPEELRSVAPPPNPIRDDVVSWFMHSADLGQGTANNKAAMYLLIAQADPAMQGASLGQRKETKRITKFEKTKPVSTKRTPAKPIESYDPTPETPASPHAAARVSPSLQLNIEIHIAPDTTVEKIDAIFESMAKHLPLQIDT